MTPSPSVAVLMSVYGGEKPGFLAEAIASIRTQTHPDLHLHLFLDGPLPPELGGVVEDGRRGWEGLLIHQGPERRGLAYCLNDLILATRGRYDFYARMDSDDISLPDRIAKQVAFLQARPEIDVAGGSIIDMDEQGRELRRVNYPRTHEEIRRFFARRNPVAHVTVMYRQSFFAKAGLYPTEGALAGLEDTLYWMQGLLAGCRFENLPEYLVRVRRSDQFLARRGGARKAVLEFKVRLRVLSSLGYGPSAYAYALGLLGVMLAPVPVKRFLYGALRG